MRFMVGRQTSLEMVTIIRRFVARNAWSSREMRRQHRYTERSRFESKRTCHGHSVLSEGGGDIHVRVPTPRCSTHGRGCSAWRDGQSSFGRGGEQEACGQGRPRKRRTDQHDAAASPLPLARPDSQFVPAGACRKVFKRTPIREVRHGLHRLVDAAALLPGPLEFGCTNQGGWTASKACDSERQVGHGNVQGGEASPGGRAWSYCKCVQGARGSSRDATSGSRKF